MSSTLVYATGVESDNRLRIARVAAAGRIAAERVALARRLDYCEKCGTAPCAREEH